MPFTRFSTRLGGRVENRVNGIEPEAVEVIVAQPHQCVVAKETAHFVAIRAIEVNGPSPGSGIAMREVRGELWEIIPGRTEMVVNDIQQNGQSPTMASIH